MLRTSRPSNSNYWGLVQQRGPWEETKIDKQNLKNTKVINLGGGVLDGGTIHAGHAQWNSRITPNPQYSNLPSMPNPSPYPLISKIIPGPPQEPITPGRVPRYRYRRLHQERQASFHPQYIEGEYFGYDPSESYPPDSTDYNDDLATLVDYETQRDLYTGPFGHTYHDGSTQNPDLTIPDTSLTSTGLTINATVPAPSNMEPALTHRPTPSEPQGPNLSYAQISTPSVYTSETDQVLTLPNGETLTPSMPPNHQISTLYDQFSDTVSNFLRDPSQREFAVSSLMNIGSIIVEYLDRNNTSSLELTNQLQSPTAYETPIEWVSNLASTIEPALESLIEPETSKPATILKTTSEPIEIQAKQLSEGIRVQSIETLQPLKPDLPEIDFKQALVNSILPNKISNTLKKKSLTTNLSESSKKYMVSAKKQRKHPYGGITGKI